MKLVAHAGDAASGRLIPLAPSSRAAKVLGDDLQLRAHPVLLAPPAHPPTRREATTSSHRATRSPTAMATPPAPLSAHPGRRA
ncbi:hypothetical protein AB0P05_42840 [Streptomyces flaveolus]|uniref:hypothetical protein n=1 Tax=Streptomyces flaveolus TaxID=67297 RepID=UPI0034120275